MRSAMQILWILVAVSKAEVCRTDWSPAEYGVMREAKCLILRYVPFRIAFAQIFGILSFWFRGLPATLLDVPGWQYIQ
jgi:hypothetical protein